MRVALDGGVCENGLIKSMSEEKRSSPKKPSSSKSGSLKKLNGEVSPKKRKHLSPTNLSKKFESPSKKSLKRDKASDSDSDMPLAELQNCISDDDDDVVLAHLNKAAKKLKKSHSQTKGLENRGTTKVKSVVKQNGTVSSSATVSDDDDDIALAVIKRKKPVGKPQNKSAKPSSNKVSPKKKVQKTLCSFAGHVVTTLGIDCYRLLQRACPARFLCDSMSWNHTPHHNCFTALFPGPPG